MSATDFYDAIGQVLSYVISADDRILKEKPANQRKVSGRVEIEILREGRVIDLAASPNERRFKLEYEYRVTRQLVNAYERDHKLLEGALERAELKNDHEYSDKQLADALAFNRVSEIEDETKNNIFEEVSTFASATNCKCQSLTRTNTEEDETIWDGIQVVRPIYPYENEFGPQNYENAIQDAINTGRNIQYKMIEGLPVLEEIDAEKPDLL